MPNALNSDDKNLLLKAADSVGIDPATFVAGNPWAEESQGVLASETLKAAVYKLNPLRASQWMAEGGVQLSLAAEATLNGERELTKKVWEELEVKMPHVVQERKERYEQQMLANLEEGLDKYKERLEHVEKYREANWQRTAQESAHHGRQWIRANQNQNIPARNYIR